MTATRNSFAASAALVLVLVVAVAAVTTYDDLVTHDTFFGDGNSNRGFTITTEGNIEVGIRAKKRTPEPGDSLSDPNDIGSQGNGIYTHPIGDDDRYASWSFDWTVNVDVNDNSDAVIGDYLYQIDIDFDTTSAVEFLTYDPMYEKFPNIAIDETSGLFADHAFGDHATDESSKVVATDYTTYAAALATYPIAQQSWNLDFFDDDDAPDLGFNSFDKAVPGIYTVALTVLDPETSELLARVAIIVAVQDGGAVIGDAPPAGVFPPIQANAVGGTSGAIGDPHFTTTDGLSYTFNGVGDFVLGHNTGANSFVLQGKLEAVSANGQVGSVITALALYDDGANEIAELKASGATSWTDTSTGVTTAGENTVLVNGGDTDGDGYIEYAFSVTGGGTYVAEIIGGVLNIYPAAAPASDGGLFGLGSDGDDSNDFTPFPTTTAPLAVDSTDEDLFYAFGWTWSADNADLFGLGSLFEVPGPTAIGSNIPTFVPTFSSPKLEAIAKDVCSVFAVGTSDYDNCLFDIAVQDNFQAALPIVAGHDDPNIGAAYGPTACTFAVDCTVAPAETVNLVDGCNLEVAYGCPTVTITPGASRGLLQVGESVAPLTDQFSYSGIETIVGDLDITSTTATEVTFEFLAVVEGSIYIDAAADSLTTLNFPALTLVTGGIYIDAAAVALTTIDLSSLTSVGCFVMEGPAVTVLDLPNLTVMNSFLVRGAAALTTINAPKLHTLTEGLALDGTPDLATLNVNALTNTRSVGIVNTKLTSVSMPALTAVSGCEAPYSYQVRGSRSFQGGMTAAFTMAGNHDTDFNDFATDTIGDFGATTENGWSYARTATSATLANYSPAANAADFECPTAHDASMADATWHTEYCYYHETSIVIEANDLLESISIPNLVTSEWVWIHDNDVLESINLNSLATASGMTVTMNKVLPMINLPSLVEVTYDAWRPSWGYVDGASFAAWDDNAATTTNWGKGVAGLAAEPNEAINLVHNADLIHSLLYGNEALNTLNLPSLTTLHGDLVLGANVYRLLDFCATGGVTILTKTAIDVHTYESLATLNLDSLEAIVGYPFDENPNTPNSIFIDLHDDNGMVCSATQKLSLKQDLAAGGSLAALSLPSLVTAADLFVTGAADLATISLPLWTGPSSLGVDGDASDGDLFFGGADNRPSYFESSICAVPAGDCFPACADDCAATPAAIAQCGKYEVDEWTFANPGDVLVMHNPSLSTLNLGSLSRASVVTVTANKALKTANFDSLVEAVALDLTGLSWSPSIDTDPAGSPDLGDPSAIGLGVVNLAPWYRNGASLIGGSVIEHATADGSQADVFTASYAEGYGFTDEVARDLSYAVLLSLAYHGDVDSVVGATDAEGNTNDRWAAYSVGIPTPTPGTTDFAGVWQAFTSLDFPALTTVYYPLSIGPAPALTEVSMPSLVTAPFLEIRYAPALVEVDFSSLVKLGAGPGEYYGSSAGCGLGVSTAPSHAAPHYDPKNHYYAHNLAMDDDRTMPDVGAMETDDSDSYSSRHGLWIGYSSFDDELGMPDLATDLSIHVTPRVPPTGHDWSIFAAVDAELAFPSLQVASSVSIVGVSGYSFAFPALSQVGSKVWVSDSQLGSLSLSGLSKIGSAKTFNMYNTVNSPGLVIEHTNFVYPAGLTLSALSRVLGNIRFTYNSGLTALSLPELRGLVGGLTVAHNSDLTTVSASQAGALKDMEVLTGRTDLAVAIPTYGYCNLLEDIFSLVIVQNEDLTTVRLQSLSGDLTTDNGDTFSTLNTVSIKYNDALTDLLLSDGLSFSREWSQACARFWNNQDAVTEPNLISSWFDLSTGPTATPDPAQFVTGSPATYANMVWTGFFTHENAYYPLDAAQDQGQWRFDTNPLTRGAQAPDEFPYEPVGVVASADAAYLLDFFHIADYDNRIDNAVADCSSINSVAWDARSLAYAAGALPAGLTIPCAGRLEIFSIAPTTIAATDGPTVFSVSGTGWESLTAVSDLIALGGFTEGAGGVDSRFQIRYLDEVVFTDAIFGAAADADLSLMLEAVTLNDDGDAVASTVTAISWTDVQAAGAVSANEILILVDPTDLATFTDPEGGDFQVRLLRGPSSIYDTYDRIGQTEDVYGSPVGADGEPLLHYAGFCQHPSDGDVGTYLADADVCLCNSGYIDVDDASNPFDAPNCNGRVGTSCFTSNEAQALNLEVKDAYFVGEVGYFLLRVPISWDRALVSFTFGGAPTTGSDGDRSPCAGFVLEKKVTASDGCTEQYLVSIETDKFALCGIVPSEETSVPTTDDDTVIINGGDGNGGVVVAGRAFDATDGAKAVAKTWYKYIVDVTSTFSDPTTFTDPATGDLVSTRKVSISNARIISYVPASFYFYLPSIEVTSEHSFEAIVISQAWNFATSTAEYTIATSARWPYQVDSATLTAYPDTVVVDTADDAVLTEQLAFRNCPASEGAFCTQRWLLEVSPTVLCDVTGSYTVSVTFGCRDGNIAYGRTTACIASGAELTLDDEINGDDICNKYYFDETSAIEADLTAYTASDYLVQSSEFLLGVDAYLQYSVESTGFAVDSAELLDVQVYRSNAVVPTATTVDVTGLTTISPSTGVYLIRFAVAVSGDNFPGVEIDTSANFRILATARMSYDDGSKKRALGTASLSPSAVVAIGNDGTGVATNAGTGAGQAVSASSNVATTVVVAVAAVALIAAIAVVVAVRTRTTAADDDYSEPASIATTGKAWSSAAVSSSLAISTATLVDSTASGEYYYDGASSASLYDDEYEVNNSSSYDNYSVYGTSGSSTEADEVSGSYESYPASTGSDQPSSLYV